MRSVIIITEKALDLNKLADAYRTSGQVDLQSAERLVVEGSWGWFAFNRENTLEEEFDEFELARIRQKMRALSFAQLEFSDSRAADIAVLGLPVDDKIMIDNDHGLIAPIGEIRRRVQEAQDWISAGC